MVKIAEAAAFCQDVTKTPEAIEHRGIHIFFTKERIYFQNILKTERNRHV
jgi:hypothetical protein